MALQHAVADHAIDSHRRAPSECRPQEVQRRAGGHQLHQRRGVTRNVGLVQKSRCFGCARTQGYDHHAQSIAGDGSLA